MNSAWRFSFILMVALSLNTHPCWAEEINPFVVLGVSPNSTAEEIQKAYRKLAMKYHPDHTGGDKAAENKLKAVTEAYHDLGKPMKDRPWQLPQKFQHLISQATPRKSSTTSASSTSNASSASGKPFTSNVSPDWKRRFDSAFSFATRPIHQKGLGWSAEAAKDWASQVASKFSSEMALATYTLQYETALQFALNPVHSGGLGKATILEARDWALGTANTLTTRASLQDFIARYLLALDWARKPARSGGQGMTNAQEARDWALAKAKSISSYSVLQRHLEALPPASATGHAMGSCFMDKLKTFFGAK